MRRGWRDQRGMTLVELLVGMAVTSIILIGLAGVLYPVSGRYQAWVDRVSTASAGLGLAGSIQADSHRLIACSLPQNGNKYELDLCVPGEPAAVVDYTISGGSAPWTISRTDGAGSSTFMARGLGPTRPWFKVDCLPATSGVASGHIHLYDFRQDGRSTENYSVYYRAPGPGSCP